LYGLKAPFDELAIGGGAASGTKSHYAARCLTT
jgi:hypothetical protein